MTTKDKGFLKSQHTFEVGDLVIVKSNYRDEQLGEFAPYGVHCVTDIKQSFYGAIPNIVYYQEIKTDKELDWVASDWFDSLSEILMEYEN